MKKFLCGNNCITFLGGEREIKRISTMRKEPDINPFERYFYGVKGIGKDSAFCSRQIMSSQFSRWNRLTDSFRDFSKDFGDSYRRNLH